MSRTIGITHRRKQTREQEARPTKVAIIDGGSVVTHDLETETSELDFLKGQFPVKWRKLDDEESVLEWFSAESSAGYKVHQCKWRKLKKEERDLEFPEGRMKWLPDSKGNLLPHLLTHVPTHFDGLKAGDRVGMLLGGSGDRFAAALSRQGEKVGASVFRIPPNSLKQLRGEKDKEDDHTTLASLVEERFRAKASDWRPFYKVRARDRGLIRVKECLALRQQALKSRIACEQRVQQAAIGRVFLNEDGMWPEGLVEDIYKTELANDVIYQGLEAEETRRDRELKAAVQRLEVWDQIFKPIEGCGERLSAGIIAAVGDIRRFWVDPDLEEMDRLYRESQRLEQEGKFEEDIDKVESRVTSETNRFQVLQMVRSYKRKIGKEREAELLDQAIACHRQRTQLRHKADQRGAAKLCHFVGTFVKQGGKYADVPPEKQFPRRRHGETSNWHPEARQALFLLADQFNRRPGSQWGKRRLLVKQGLRERHPQPIEVTVKEGGKEVTKKRYTDGHIHKMSAWSTLAKFVRFLFREWTRIERAALARENGGRR